MYSNAVQQVVERIVDSFPKVSGGEPYLSRETNEVLQAAVNLSTQAGDQFVTLEYLLLALLKTNNQAGKILKDAGATEKGWKLPLPN